MPFSTRRAQPDESDRLFDIWWRSASATHTFLSLEDLQTLAPAVRQLDLASLDTWVLCDAGDGPVAFLVLAGAHIEALFVAPEWIGRGAGTALLRHAHSLHERLSVDVNEQNTAAVSFYRARGFVIRGRSETDGEGRPFPLLHLSEEPLSAGAGSGSPR